MFEAALLKKLSSDGALAGYLSTYAGAPAIFSEMAPDGVIEPYLVYTISRSSDENLAVMAFNVYVDIFTRDVSRTGERAASQRVEFLLDHVVFDDVAGGRFDNIRTFFYSAGSVPEGDSRKAHYNMQFTARAGRKAWAAQIT